MEKVAKKKAYKLRRVWDYVQTEKSFEKKSDLPSMTVPNEAYTMREIMEKFTNNLPVAGVKEIGYDSKADFDSDDIEKMKDLDLFEREQKSREIASRMDEQKEQLQQDIKKRKEQMAKEREELEEVKKEVRRQKEKRQLGQGETRTNDKQSE